VIVVTRFGEGYCVTAAGLEFCCAQVDPRTRRVSVLGNLDKELATGDLSDLLQACWRVRAWKETGVSPANADPPIVAAYRYLLRDLERHTPKFEKIALVKTRIQALIAEATARHLLKIQE
jgi:hypothetical protein